MIHRFPGRRALMAAEVDVHGAALVPADQLSGREQRLVWLHVLELQELCHGHHVKGIGPGNGG